MSMLASLKDARSLLTIMEDCQLTSVGAGRIKSSGVLAELVKMANKDQTDLLRATDFGLPFIQAFTEAGWTTQEIEKLLQDKQQLKLWHDQFCGLKEISPETGNQNDGSCLRLHETFILPERNGMFDPAQRYIEGRELHVWTRFKQFVLCVAQPVSFVTKLKIDSYELIEVATDLQIRSELSRENVFFDTSTFCARLFGMITRQPQGSYGLLITNGRANMFHVVGVVRQIFVVYAYWSDRRWNVRAEPFGTLKWSPGSRMFLPSTA